MSDYFDRFEQSMGTALQRGANLPWYSRGVRLRHPRLFISVFGALAVGAPAGAVTSCFGACPPPPRTTVTARQVPQGATASQLLSVGADDPRTGRRRADPPRGAGTSRSIATASSSSTPLTRPSSASH